MNDRFTKFCKIPNNELMPVPEDLYNKNAIGARHILIKSTCLKVVNGSTEMGEEIIAL